jgi:group I intron endonuclease
MILNRRNLKVYVGKTDNVDARFREHFSGKGGARVLQSAIAKYGPENFVCVIFLAGIQDQTELNSAEIAAIAHLDCLATGKRGYNLQLGGNGGKQAPETKAKIGVAIKKKHESRTPAEREAISAARKESNRHALRSQTAEEKAVLSAKISAGQKKKHASRTPEARAAIGAAISASNKGKTRSLEARAAISSGSVSKKSVIVIMLHTSVEIACTSFVNAAKEMGVRRQTIGNLVNNVIKKSKSKGGQYAGQIFTARFRDE